MKRRRFSTDEVAEIIRLRRNERMSVCEIASRFGASTAGIYAHVKMLPLTEEERKERSATNILKGRQSLSYRAGRSSGAEWLRSEDEVLKELYPAGEQSEIIARLPGRKWGAIMHRASFIGLRRTPRVTHRRYVDPIIARLRRIRDERRISREQLAHKMGIHAQELTSHELGITPCRTRRLRDWIDSLECEFIIVEKIVGAGKKGTRPWLPEEDQLLRELTSQGARPAEIGRAIRRRRVEVDTRLKDIGLDDEKTRFISGMMKARSR